MHAQLYIQTHAKGVWYWIYVPEKQLRYRVIELGDRWSVYTDRVDATFLTASTFARELDVPGTHVQHALDRLRHRDEGVEASMPIFRELLKTGDVSRAHRDLDQLREVDTREDAERRRDEEDRIAREIADLLQNAGGLN